MQKNVEFHGRLTQSLGSAKFHGRYQSVKEKNTKFHRVNEQFHDRNIQFHSRHSQFHGRNTPFLLYIILFPAFVPSPT